MLVEPLSIFSGGNLLYPNQIPDDCYQYLTVNNCKSILADDKNVPFYAISELL